MCCGLLMVLVASKTIDAFPTAKICKEWSQNVFIGWTKPHFSHFEV